MSFDAAQLGAFGTSLPLFLPTYKHDTDSDQLIHTRPEWHTAERCSEREAESKGGLLYCCCCCSLESSAGLSVISLVGSSLTTASWNHIIVLFSPAEILERGLFHVIVALCLEGYNSPFSDYFCLFLQIWMCCPPPPQTYALLEPR